MKEITVLSGKGGTGKTSLTAALASLHKNLIITDCDVEASDLHLVLKPQIREVSAFSNGFKARIQTDNCTSCGLCAQHCAFEAIRQTEEGYLIQDMECEGCGLCYRLCPEEAILFEEEYHSKWYVSEIANGKLVHANMGPGEENSGKLVAQLRERARQLAKQESLEMVLNDGPPGIGCPVISSITGVDGVLFVTEPTQSGLHDLKRVHQLAKKFHLKCWAVINKADLNEVYAGRIQEYLSEQHIPLLASIPFEEDLVRALEAGLSITQYNADHPVSRIIERIDQNICQDLKQTS